MRVTAVAVSAVLAGPGVLAAEDPVMARARQLHREALVVDTHSDTTTRMLDEGLDIGVRAADGHMDLPRMQEGGIDAEFFAIWVAASYARDGGAARRALELIDAVHAAAARHPQALELARTADDVRRIAARGRVAALMGIEGGHAIEDSLAALRMFHSLGVRYMTLTHTNTNNWCDSSGDVPRWGGLNDLGRRVVREMNRIGMLVDVSHVSDQAFYAVLDTTTVPVFASHSSCRSLCSHPRNMTDDMIRALARNGGVVQINFSAEFVDETYMLAVRDLRRRIWPGLETRFAGDPAGLRREWQRTIRESPPAPFPGAARLVDHVDHVVKLVGADHVGLGTDYDGVSAVPVGLEDCSKLPLVTYELLKRGYSEADVRKILGGNTLRVMEAAERGARGATLGTQGR